MAGKLKILNSYAPEEYYFGEQWSYQKGWLGVSAAKVNFATC